LVSAARCQPSAVKCSSEQLPFNIDLLQPAKTKSPEAKHAFNHPKNRFYTTLAQAIEPLAFFALESSSHPLAQSLGGVPALAFAPGSPVATGTIWRLQRTVNPSPGGAFDLQDVHGVIISSVGDDGLGYAYFGRN
jgi:hypothetical protein